MNLTIPNLLHNVKVQDKLKLILDNITPVRIVKVDQVNHEKWRPTKTIFSIPQNLKSVLLNKNKIIDNFIIRKDECYKQAQYFTEVNMELNSQISNGKKFEYEVHKTYKQ